MGLFDRKKTNYSDSQPLYTLGNNQTLLVVGLGNIGAKYAKNRHNVGFMAIDRYKESHEFGDWMEKKDLKCHLTANNVGSTRVILAKPTTLMNLSGESVQRIMQFYKVSEMDLLVIHDELDIEFGAIRCRVGGSSAGHNGIKSLLTHLQPEFGRVRVGIGPKSPSKIDSADFVLQDFSAEQVEKLPKILKEVCALIDERTVSPLLDATISI